MGIGRRLLVRQKATAETYYVRRNKLFAGQFPENLGLEFTTVNRFRQNRVAPSIKYSTAGKRLRIPELDGRVCH